MDRNVKFVLWSAGKPHFSDVRTCLVPHHRQICQTGKQKSFGQKQACILETEARDGKARGALVEAPSPVGGFQPDPHGC